MATWQCTAQLTTGTLTLTPTDHIWWNGSAFGTNVVLNTYQDTTHIADTSDVHRCTTAHVHNTKYIDGTHVSIDGAASSALPIATGSCGLRFNFSDPSSVTTSGAKFYAYDGTNDVNPMAGINFYAAEGGQSTSWIAANGSGSALNLHDQAAATSHDFYISTSAAPTSAANKTGKLKIVLTYV